MNNEGALIAFTLLGQMIIGSTLVYALFHFFSVDAVSKLSSGFSLKTPELLFLIILLVAILISFFHLGQASNATKALNNLKSSWVSREILSLTIFSISLALLFLGRWLGAGKSLLNLLFILSSVSGLILLLSMTRLYMIPAVDSWNNYLTPLSFSLAAIISGISLMLLICVIFRIESFITRPLLLVLIVFLVLDAISSGLFLGMLNNLADQNQVFLQSEGVFKVFAILRISLILVATFFLVFAYVRGKAEIQNFLLILSIILIFLELIIGRYIFFASFVREGI